MTITMRATFQDVEWESDEPDTEPTITGGFTDPNNPWGGFRSEAPEGLVGEAFVAWRDENVETLTFDDIEEAAEFIVDFPGGVWDWCEGESSTDYKTGVNTEVTLHVESDWEILYEGPTIRVIRDDAAAAFNRATILQAEKDAHLKRMIERMHR